MKKKQMRKLTICLVVFLVIVSAVSSCSGLGGSQVNLNEEFALSPGQLAFVEGENLSVKFLEVVEDSRCPRGVTCIWTGRIAVIVELTHAGSSDRLTLTEPGLTDEYSKESHQGYELAFQVTPYPQAAEEIPTSAYRLHLIIRKLPELTSISSDVSLYTESKGYAVH
ncbi:MAG: hypothetical protein PHI12_06240 [Dehalococcoidales bacterium]|nr:hypothetical protein [Dehalococcoidales bacterium]